MMRINKIKRLRIILIYLISIAFLVKILAAFQEVPALQDCNLCRIVAGEESCQKIWESKSHMAFLDPYQGASGATVVISKQHFSSNFFELPKNVQRSLMKAAESTSKILKEKLVKNGGVTIIIESCAANHLHLKLYPINFPLDKDLNCRETDFTGQSCSAKENCTKAKEEDLKELAAYLRDEKNSLIPQRL